jgi:hypothetical protein
MFHSLFCSSEKNLSGQMIAHWMIETAAFEDVWVFLDIVEMRLAKELGGIIFASDEGFFDERNHPLCCFS